MQEQEIVNYDIDYTPTEPDLREDDCYFFWDKNKMIDEGILIGEKEPEVVEVKYIKPVQYNLFSQQVNWSILD